MKSLLPLIKKDLKRFFTDKRLLMSLILPGLLIFFMYSALGSIMESVYSLDDDKVFEVYVENNPPGYNAYFDLMGLDVNVNDVTADTDLEKVKEGITNGIVDLLIIFPENFDDVFGNDYSNQGDVVPQVEIYYNADIMDSYILFVSYSTLLNEFEADITNLFDINNKDDQYNLSVKSDDINPMTSMIPMLLLMFLVTGVVSLATESIAGEKERGTIATLLITPVSRFKISFAKIISVSIPALASAIVSFLGLYLSLPSLTKMMGDSNSISLGGLEIISLLLIMLVTILMFSVLMCIVSALAKSVKESQQYTAPLIFVATIAGMMTMFFTFPSTSLFFIPILNSSLAINEIFTGTFNVTQLLVTLFSNITITAIGVFVMGKMFNSEKIIFTK